jgi:phosphate transport system substrate-binding protein
VTTDTTNTLLRSLASAYSRDNTLVAVVDQSANGVNIAQAFEPRPPGLPLLYALTTYLPESDALWAAPLGEDGIAIIVHPQLMLEGLSVDDLRRIFVGVESNWSAFGGPDLPIAVVSRELESDTRQAFQDLVLGKRQITFNALLAPTGEAMLNIVAQTPGAIGYLSMARISGAVRVMPVAGSVGDQPVIPSPQTVADGSYPLRTPLLVVGSQPPTPGDGYYEFIVWAQQKQGQRIIAESFAPLPRTQ